MMNHWTSRFFALFLLLALLPLFFVISVMIALFLGHPVFFKQERIGLYNRPFKCYKFRTMRDIYVDGKLLPDEHRMTIFGNLLRKLSLDELPQLLNIIKGDMVFIGPRPQLSEFMPHYSLDQLKRHLVKPGITGWAQVNGRNGISWEKRFELDVFYVEHQSILLDAWIVFKTVKCVCFPSSVSANGHVTMPRFEGSCEEVSN